MQNVYEKLISCYESIQEKIPFTPKVALVLGSGLGDYAEEIRVEAELDYHEIDGFPVSIWISLYGILSACGFWI